MGAFYPYVGSTRWIVASDGGGSTVTLDDGSLWLIDDAGIETVRRWHRTQTVDVGVPGPHEVAYRLRGERGDAVRAHYLGFERIEPLSVLAPEIGQH